MCRLPAVSQQSVKVSCLSLLSCTQAHPSPTKIWIYRTRGWCHRLYMHAFLQPMIQGKENKLSVIVFSEGWRRVFKVRVEYKRPPALLLLPACSHGILNRQHKVIMGFWSIRSNQRDFAFEKAPVWICLTDWTESFTQYTLADVILHLILSTFQQITQTSRF